MAPKRLPFEVTYDALTRIGNVDGYSTVRGDSIQSQHTHVDTIPQQQGALPNIELVEKSDTDPCHPAGFRLTHVIGEGGMGTVYSAHQPSLTREVAIKRVRASKNNANIAAAIVHEAQLLARLEHPNIPPVHLLGHDASGRPILVMKRVRGHTWSKLVKKDGHSWWRPASGDKLAHNLRILIQVCNVIAYAHSRHVLHRDIKLDNVMIDSFGETYVLDWGAAVALDLNGEFVTKSFSGTPANAAPEMVRCDRPLTAQTDVYLLGALLHEIITGTPRHRGKTLKHMLRSAAFSRPVEYPETVPKTLAQLCNEAMDRDPEQRPKSAITFRERIEEFLELRSAVKLLDTADELLDKLKEQRKQQITSRESQDDMDSEEDRAQFHNLVIRCRFAYEQVLHSVPSLETAHDGLAQCLELQVLQTADNRNYLAAETLLNELWQVYGIDKEHRRTLQGYIETKKQTHRERRDELATQVQHALVDRLRLAEERVRELEKQLEGDPDNETRRIRKKT